jgi:uncharacterized damage-inducible protein DinB
MSLVQNGAPIGLGLTIEDLIEYTGWERAKWRAWFETHPQALRFSAGPNGDGRFSTVGDLVKHIFSAEQRYVQRLTGEPLTDFARLASDDDRALFAVGDASRSDLTRLVTTLPAADWDSPREYTILTYLVKTTPRKIVIHVLMHEIRHWAQIATLCRLNGHVCEFHDFLASPVWGGEFRPAPAP